MSKRASSAKSPTRNRAKISVTIDPTLLYAVDRYVHDHAGLDRSKVMETALQDWYRIRQDEAMADQFSDMRYRESEEYRSWRKLRRAAAARTLNRPDR